MRNLNDYETMGRKLRVDFSNEGGGDNDNDGPSQVGYAPSIAREYDSSLLTSGRIVTAATVQMVLASLVLLHHRPAPFLLCPRAKTFRPMSLPQTLSPERSTLCPRSSFSIY